MLADAAEHFFPRTSMTRETLARAEALIADGDLDLSIRRRLVDEADTLERKLAVLEALPTAMKARRPGPTVRTRVHELGADGERRHEDRLATEEPLEIRLAWPGAAAAPGLGDDADARATTSSSPPAGWSTRGWSPRRRTRSPTAPTPT